ncbi:DUF6247 family protein [Actinomadura sp. 9N407]|uniref:DUF6247 family protein n=1 Tax=Actinomadura sp. 9N407 TaxID=3375154 RepID=UPI003799877D
MSAQPVDPAHRHDPGDDPAAIYNALPHSFRKQFRDEYDAALDAAHDFERYRQIREVVRQWRLRAIAYSGPYFEEGVRAALEGRDDEFVGADQIDGWAGRL